MSRYARAGLSFGCQTHTLYGDNNFLRMSADGCFTRQHDRIGTFENGIGYIRYLRPGGNRTLYHGFHHLGGRDDRFVQRTGPVNNALLNGRHLGIADFNPQISPCYHNSVWFLNDFIDGLNSFSPFNFGNDGGCAIYLVEQPASLLNIRCTANKGDSDIICLHLSGGFQVFAIFVRQGAGGKPSAFAIDPLVVGQFSANFNRADDARPVDAVNLQFDTAVIQQQDIPRDYIFWQFLVVQADSFWGPGRFRQCGVQNELSARIKRNRAVFKLSNADFRTLKVCQNSDLASQGGGIFSDGVYAILVINEFSMGKIDAHQIHTGPNQPFDWWIVIGGRAHCGYYFRAS